MVKYKIIVFAFLLSQFAFCQNFVQSNMLYPTCYGSCNGSVVFSTTTTTGPFTAVLSNSSSCANTTVQSSTGNSITISSLCPCASVYSVSFYNSSMVLVGYELLQVPITATAPLILNTPTVSPAACSTCCDGSVHISWSGGYTPPPNGPTITLDGSDISTAYFPNPTVCVGNHTVCVRDLANCIVCTTFSMGFVTHVGIKNSEKESSKLIITPNPADNQLLITTGFIESPKSVRFMDLSGKVALEISEFHASFNNYPVDISSLVPGIYFIEFENSENSIFRQKLIKTGQ